jgi:hypothetical protein
MLPQHLAKPVHDSLHLAQSQLPLPILARDQIRPHLLQALVDLPVLAQELQFVSEGWHALPQLWEHVPFFDEMVRLHLLAKVDAGAEELTEREIGWSLICIAYIIQGFPGLTEVVMLLQKISVFLTMPVLMP